MTDQVADPIEIAQALIRCPSVTPRDEGALDYLHNLFNSHGFRCRRLAFSEQGTPDVDNLYARIGHSSPHLCFAGHTDVVPPGDLASWSHPPFAAEISDGKLYGRGAADMKGGIAAFAAATLTYLQRAGHGFPGSISFLITGDEEGPAINGTKKMLLWLKEQREVIDHCVVGEPTNPQSIGQAIKIGRRGSLNGYLKICGKQGHVAYPDLAYNPVPGLLAVLTSFKDLILDEGSAHFAPSNLEITSVDVGNRAENVIPETASANFNIRFNDHHSGDSLKALLRERAGVALENQTLSHEFRFGPVSDCFLTEPGPLSDILIDAIKSVTGAEPELSTSGGTSDARFIKDYCPVIEFGLVNATIHQANEHVPVEDLKILPAIYERFIEGYFG